VLWINGSGSSVLSESESGYGTKNLRKETAEFFLKSKIAIYLPYF
jgi:hypothetical protein